MFKKMVFLSVLIFSVLMLSGCGAVNVQLPAADGSGAGVSIAPVDGAAPAPAADAPATGAIDSNVLLYVIIGLVGVIVLIALIVVIGGRRGSGNNM